MKTTSVPSAYVADADWSGDFRNRQPELNSKLEYTSDSLDGRLITGDDAQCLRGH
jgi:hypothetical protein